VKAVHDMSDDELYVAARVIWEDRGQGSLRLPVAREVGAELLERGFAERPPLAVTITDYGYAVPDAPTSN